MIDAANQVTRASETKEVPIPSALSFLKPLRVLSEKDGIEIVLERCFDDDVTLLIKEGTDHHWTVRAHFGDYMLPYELLWPKNPAK
jgi:hypothetical protein